MSGHSNVDKMRSDDRILLVNRKDGCKPLDGNTGLIDNRIFKGTVKLHAVMDPKTTLWSLHYDNMAKLPLPLQQKYTSFNKLMDHVEGYFNRRNLEITGVLD